jgi:flavin-dependent dehydrogenase
MAAICVIGAGPAGSTFAARMVQLGHQVCLLERARFPRRHLGESLTPGVLPLLETTGARTAVEAAGFRRIRRVHVKWDSPFQIREDTRAEGLLVERGTFDELLLEHVQALGARVLQPARVRQLECHANGWRIQADTDGGPASFRADFLAEATGRSARMTANRQHTACRTLALYAYWRGRALPDEPCIEAGSNAWYWGVPLPDGSYNTLVFVDVRHFRTAGTLSLTERFLQLLRCSSLAAACRDAERVGPVRATDATPYLDGRSVTSSSIKVGEAALAVDPISSSGVQKAIQSALAGAVVANTLLKSPAASEAALRFYQANLADASERHCRWAASHYGAVAARGAGSFWVERAVWGDRAARLEWVPPELPGTPVSAQSMAALRVTISRQLEFVELPCIEGDFVTIKSALRHPNLESPVAYLGDWELAPLLRRLPPGSTPLQLAQSWSSRISLSAGLAIAGWLIKHGILVEGTSDHAREPAR